MGRALFSQNYSTPPSPQAPIPDLDIRNYDTWSKSNPFDPDSDEFFIDAVYEAFLDPSEYQRQQNSSLRAVLPDDDDDDLDTRNPIVMQIDTDRDSGVSLSSGSPLLSSRTSPSPMAVGPDDPAIILADAGYSESALSAEWHRARSPMAEGWLHMGRSVPDPPHFGYTPPLVIDDGDTDAEPLPIRPDPVRSQDRPPSGPRTVSITPIDVTPVERRPSPAPRTAYVDIPVLQPPHTPPRSRDTSLMTPSPAPTVTPRIYSWHSPRPPAPPSPLTNPSARISLSRINLPPSHVRIHSTAVSP